MNIGEINEFLEKNKIPAYRLKQVIKAIYQESVSSFEEITVLPKDLRGKMSEEIDILPFGDSEIFISKKKDSYKALLELRDGKKIETVLLKQDGFWSTCISSQVGCALGCRFCATGASGFSRNLTSEEIIGQVLFWKQYIKTNKLENNLRNIVFMGMGEPFMNYSEVKKSIQNLLDPEVFNFGVRHLSLSTSGLPEGIKDLARDFPQMNLAISIIAADDEKRTSLMPINKKFNLRDINKALDYYFERTKRKVFLEYIMFHDLNDSKKDANNLVSFVKGNSRPDLLHVNLIAYNTTGEEFKSSSRATIDWFRNYMLKNKINTTVRKSLGEEIKAACGQLAGEKK